MNWFSMTSMSPYKGEVKTMRLHQHPLKRMHGPMGYVKDADGNEWDLGGLANGCVLARPVVPGLDPWYSTASNANPSGTRRWIPYNVEIVEEENV